MTQNDRTIFLATLNQSINESVFYSTILVSFCQFTYHLIIDKRMKNNAELMDDLSQSELDIIRSAYDMPMWASYFKLIENYIDKIILYAETLAITGLLVEKSDDFIEKNRYTSSILLAFYGEVLAQKQSRKFKLIKMSSHYRQLIDEENKTIEKMIMESYSDFFRFV